MWIVFLPWFLGVEIAFSQSTFNVILNGANAGTPSPGTGFGVVRLNGNQITYDISYSGLLGFTLESHVHELPSGVIVLGLTPFDPLTVGSGRFFGTATYLPAQVSSLQAGNQYVNIHTTTALYGGAGEIRGTIVPVPEPSTVGLLLLGVITGLSWRFGGKCQERGRPVPDPK